MAVTRSKAVERAEIRRLPGQRTVWRIHELGWMLVVGLAVMVGLVLVYRAKSPDLSEIEKGLASKKLLNLNELSAREDLLPALGIIPSQSDRVEDAGKIYYLSGGLSNVGAVAFQHGPDDRRSVSRVEAAVRGAPARAVPTRFLPVVRTLPGGVPPPARVVEPARVPRRPDPPSGGPAVERRRADPHDQPARSSPRQSSVRRFRTGCGGRLRPAGGCGARSTTNGSSAN